MNHADHDVHTLAGAYALDALTDLERTTFERHLGGCASCHTEIIEMRATAARLADPVATQPPRRLRIQVLAQATRTAQIGPGRTASHPAGPWRRRMLAVAAAVLIAAAGLTTGLAIQNHQADRARATARQQTAQARRLTDLLTAPDARVTTYTTASGARVTVVTSAIRDQGAALLAGLPAPGPDHAYQLWLIKGTTPAPAGILPAGTTSAVSWLTHVRGSDAFGISREDPGGATTPSIPLIASFPLT